MNLRGVVTVYRVATVAPDKPLVMIKPLPNDNHEPLSVKSGRVVGDRTGRDYGALDDLVLNPSLS